MRDLKYVIVPGQWPRHEAKDLYREIYHCWESNWNQAFKELGKPEGFLKSDPFTRQDYVGGIFLDTRCVALSFFRWSDASMPPFRSDSYFANWSETHIQKLRSRGDQLMICSYFVIAKEARGRDLGFSMRDLLIGLSLKVFLNSGADALSGTPRTDRKMNEACALWGGQEIAREIPSGHGDTVDLMGFFPDVLAKTPRQPLSDLIDQVWDQRTDTTANTTKTSRVLKIAG